MSVVVVDVQCDCLFPPLLTNIFLSSYDTSASDEADHAGHLPHSASHNYIERLTTHIEGVRRRFVRSIHSPSNSTSLMQYSLSSLTILASTTTNQSFDTLTDLPKLPADDDQHHENEAADEDTKFFIFNVDIDLIIRWCSRLPRRR